MEPARTIIERLGGEAKVSEITGTAYTAPYRWQHEREKGGTGGRIPQQHHRALLAFARENAIELAAEELLPIDGPQPRKSSSGRRTRAAA